MSAGHGGGEDEVVIILRSTKAYKEARVHCSRESGLESGPWRRRDWYIIEWREGDRAR